MPIHTGELRFTTEGDGDVIDLTAGVRSVVHSSGAMDGTVSVFVPGSTAAVTTMEFEPGGVHDLKAALERLVPREGRLGTGTWQQIVLVDFDDSPRRRTVVVQVVS